MRVCANCASLAATACLPCLPMRAVSAGVAARVRNRQGVAVDAGTDLRLSAETAA
jgi:hypothetical protein